MCLKTSQVNDGDYDFESSAYTYFENPSLIQPGQLTLSSCAFREKRRKVLYAFFLHFLEIWTEQNKIKLCGGVEMVCTCIYTPDDAPFWKDTHCVLGLDDSGKVGACEWNHLQRVDQFLISSLCYEKKQLNIQNSLTNSQNFKPQFK